MVGSVRAKRGMRRGGGRGWGEPVINEKGVSS